MNERLEKMGQFQERGMEIEDQKRLEEEIFQLKHKQDTYIEKLSVEIIQLKSKEKESAQILEDERRKHSELLKEFETLMQAKKVFYYSKNNIYNVRKLKRITKRKSMKFTKSSKKCKT